MHLNQVQHNGNAGDRKKRFFEKEFKIRNSILTEKFANCDNARTIYNLWLITHLTFLIHTVIQDYTTKGQFNLGFRLIPIAFNKFHLVVLIWCFLNLLAFLVYHCFIFWANIRQSSIPKHRQFWDWIWITTLFFYYCFSLYFIQNIVAALDFAAGSAVVLLLEQVRLLMKQYAFIRTNAPRVLIHKAHSDETLTLPSFRKFVYFLFAPTTIYRDEYPRTEKIRWKFVAINVGEFFGIVWFLSLMVERQLKPFFQDVCLRKFTFGEVLVPIAANTFPAVLTYFASLHAVLHSSQNAFAEMLRFGDRIFYKEWWTSTSFSEYYRDWNIPVHDWLLTFVYKDVYEIVVPKNKLVARVAVFLMSAVFHEWIIACTLGFFFPVQLASFITAGAMLAVLNILDKPMGNLLIMIALIFGLAININIYTLEMFARTNCALGEDATTLDFYKPRIITCSCIE